MLSRDHPILWTYIEKYMQTITIRLTPIKKEINVKVDTGYLGINSLHSNSDIPKKKTKKYLTM